MNIRSKENKMESMIQGFPKRVKGCSFVIYFLSQYFTTQPALTAIRFATKSGTNKILPVLSDVISSL